MIIFSNTSVNLHLCARILGCERTLGCTHTRVGTTLVCAKKLISFYTKLAIFELLNEKWF